MPKGCKMWVFQLADVSLVLRIQYQTQCQHFSERVILETSCRQPSATILDQFWYNFDVLGTPCRRLLRPPVLRNAPAWPTRRGDALPGLGWLGWGIPLQVGLTHPLAHHMGSNALKSYQKSECFWEAYFSHIGEQKLV